MKKELFLFFFKSFIFITTGNLGAQFRGTQKWYIIVDFDLNQACE